uniref:Uncharacterized protein n=1 Tax=Vespula pensylvanica TaxID=30213 RepID=A0A834PGS9_VESPE|nr:hypothetical protein H0235_001794 [Vespula pensylvanica]
MHDVFRLDDITTRDLETHTSLSHNVGHRAREKRDPLRLPVAPTQRENIKPLGLVEGNPIRILVGPFKFVVVVSRRQDGSYTAPRFSRTRDERKQGAGLAAGAASYKFPERLVVTAVLYRALALELYDP